MVVTQYIGTSLRYMWKILPARLILDSTYGNINIYNIRIYEKSVFKFQILYW